MYNTVDRVIGDKSSCIHCQLAETRKLLSFSKNYKLSYVYLWQLKTPKTDSKGKPMRDPDTGKVIYRRTPSFKIINRLKNVIPTEYWYEEATVSVEEDYASRSDRGHAPLLPHQGISGF